MYVAVRSAVSNPLTLIPSVQEAVWSIDRNVPLANPRTMQDVLAHSVLRRRFAMLLLSIFAGLATLLAAIGLYGVISYSVAQRTKEIGIRMALGGQRSDMLRMVLRQSGMLALAGIMIGVPIALAATRFLGTMLYGVGAPILPPMFWSSRFSLWRLFWPASSRLSAPPKSIPWSPFVMNEWRELPVCVFHRNGGAIFQPNEPTKQPCKLEACATL